MCVCVCVCVMVSKCIHIIAHLLSTEQRESKAMFTLNGSRSNQFSEHPHGTLKTMSSPLSRYHLTNDRWVRVGSLLMESVDKIKLSAT